MFKQTSPVIKLSATANSDDFLSLLALLNSSSALFWARQTFQPKGGYSGGRWEERLEWDNSKIKTFPVPTNDSCCISKALDELGWKQSNELSVQEVLRTAVDAQRKLKDALASARVASESVFNQMVALQEEIDWQSYRYYGLINNSDELEWPLENLADLPPLRLGQRAFEIRMARLMASGELETTWFERHKDAGSNPVIELPTHWPDKYRSLVERRLAFIEKNKNINLIERPEYKRRWKIQPWKKRREAALEKLLLTRMEGYFYDADRMVEGKEKLDAIKSVRKRLTGGRSAPSLVSVRQIVNAVQTDELWMEAAANYTDRTDFEIPKLVEKLILSASVPFLPVQRYKVSGLHRRIEWENAWNLQRAEDRVVEKVRSDKADQKLTEEQLTERISQVQLDEVGEIHVPLNYKSADFIKKGYWKLRGKLDVPKERWILYPGLEGGIDDSPVIAWAGWDHAQQAQALTTFYEKAKNSWGWEPSKLTLVLAGLNDILPWLHQWHNELDPEYGDRICDTYQQFYETECHFLGLSPEAIETLRMGATN